MRQTFLSTHAAQLKYCTITINAYYLPIKFGMPNLDQDGQVVESQDPQLKEGHSSQNPIGKKIIPNSSKRILKDHDLDQLLVYEKRGAKQSKDFYEEWAHQEQILTSRKKERKIKKMEEKKVDSQAQQKIHTNKGLKIIQKKTQSNSFPLEKIPSVPLERVTPLPLERVTPLPLERVTPLPLKKISKTTYKIPYDDSNDYQRQFKFPFVNSYLSEHGEEFLDTMGVIDRANKTRQKGQSESFVNCDVRYFNWNLFMEEVGKFDVLIIDPPWRIKGAQKNDSQFMFSNCRFSLEYNTMSNHEIKTLPLHLISDQGFIFLWILNTQLNSSLEIMQAWGYELVEELVWVKLRNQKVYLTHGYYFMHSYEICLVGYKNNRKDGQSMMLRHGINPNVVFGEVRKKSQKPEDLYSIIEMIFKGKRKIQVFARNHNLRFGLFSVGNELGEAYDKWKLHLKCDECNTQIKSKSKRFKSKVKANFDICENCSERHDKAEFFEFNNEVDEDVRHEYTNCDYCQIQPIWGVRFQCLGCMDYDLCENCFDQFLLKKNEQIEGGPDNFHPSEHEFRTLEVPVFGWGFAIHESKCNSCYQSPIVGTCISCTSCRNYNLCQKCFFERPLHERQGTTKAYRCEHKFQVVMEPRFNQERMYDCFNCKKVIMEDCWMCENCYNFFFCDKCYHQRDSFKSLYANNHKKYHVLTKFF